MESEATSPASEELGLPPQAAAALSRVLRDAFDRGRLTEDRVRRVQYAVESAHSLDYSVNAEAFAYLYFAANFAKAVQAMRRFVRRNRSGRLRVLDLGCGAGPASLAAVQHLSRCGALEGSEIELVGVDTVCEQLKLFQRLTGPLVQQLEPRITVSPVLQDALKFVRESREHWDLVLCSYLFIELEPAERNGLEAMLHQRLREGSQVILIDRGTSGTRLFDLGKGATDFKYPRRGLEVEFLRAVGLDRCPKRSKSDRAVAS